MSDLKIQWYSWWMAHSLDAIALRYEFKPTHANWLEAFPFTIVSDLPEGEKTPPHVPSDIMNAKTAREVYGDGSFGGRYQVPQQVMDEIFEAAGADILKLLDFD